MRGSAQRSGDQPTEKDSLSLIQNRLKWGYVQRPTAVGRKKSHDRGRREAKRESCPDMMA